MNEEDVNLEGIRKRDESVQTLDVTKYDQPSQVLYGNADRHALLGEVDRLKWMLDHMVAQDAMRTAYIHHPKDEQKRTELAADYRQHTMKYLEQTWKALSAQHQAQNLRLRNGG